MNKTLSHIHRLLSGFCCVSCVPASCVHIWFVSCPCFMSLWVKYVPAVFVSLCVNYPVYISPVFWVWFRLVYSLLPRCILSLSPALSCLVLPWCLIKDYYLSLCPRLRVPVPPSCVHRDRRPDLTISGAHSPRFAFVFESFVLFQSVCLCLSRGMEVAARYSRHSPLQVGVGVRRECRESTGRESSCPPIAGDIRHRRWLSQARWRGA